MAVKAFSVFGHGPKRISLTSLRQISIFAGLILGSAENMIHHKVKNLRRSTRRLQIAISRVLGLIWLPGALERSEASHPSVINLK